MRRVRAVSEEDKQEIRTARQRGERLADVVSRMNLSKSTVAHYYYGKAKYSTGQRKARTPYIEVDMTGTGTTPSGEGDVLVILTKSSNLKKVLGELGYAHS